MKTFFYILAALTALEPSGSKQLALDYLDHKIEVPYENYTYSQYHILAADENVVNGLFLILEDTDYKRKWNDSIGYLGSIGRLDPTLVKFDDIKNLALYFEGMPYEDKSLKHLNRAYVAVARYGNDEALDFLIERTKKSFWEGKTMPEGTAVLTDPHHEFLETAQGKAFLALALHPSDTAEHYLREQQNNPELDEVSHRNIKSGLTSRNAWFTLDKIADEAQRMKEERQRELQAQADGDKSPGLESPPVSDVPIPEPETALWWPWALGGVIVLALLGFLLLRRSDKD